MKVKIIGLLIAALVFSCKSHLEGGTFHVTTLNGKDVSAKNMTLKIDMENHRISGNTGCNGFGAEFKVQNDSIDLGMVRATKMYCEGQMDLENRFFKNLGKVKTYHYDGEELKLFSQEDLPVIVAERVKKEHE